MAARTAQLAFLVDQLVTALQAISPVFAGVIGGIKTANLIYLRPWFAFGLGIDHVRVYVGVNF
jgi:hypothetical protein